MVPWRGECEVLPGPGCGVEADGPPWLVPVLFKLPRVCILCDV